MNDDSNQSTDMTVFINNNGQDSSSPEQQLVQSDPAKETSPPEQAKTQPEQKQQTQQAKTQPQQAKTQPQQAKTQPKQKQQTQSQKNAPTHLHFLQKTMDGIFCEFVQNTIKQTDKLPQNTYLSKVLGIPSDDMVKKIILSVDDGMMCYQLKKDDQPAVVKVVVLQSERDCWIMSNLINQTSTSFSNTLVLYANVTNFQSYQTISNSGMLQVDLKYVNADLFYILQKSQNPIKFIEENIPRILDSYKDKVYNDMYTSGKELTDSSNVRLHLKTQNWNFSQEKIQQLALQKADFVTWDFILQYPAMRDFLQEYIYIETNQKGKKTQERFSS